MGGEPFVPTFLRTLPLEREALAFAERVHGGQRRESDQAACVLHPIEFAALLHNIGDAEAVVAAGILHETIEATETGPDEIRARFGDAVGALVEALTEDASIARELVEVAQTAVGEYPGASVLLEPQQLRAAAHRGVGVAVRGEDDDLPRWVVADGLGNRLARL
jgi:HD domain